MHALASAAAAVPVLGYGYTGEGGAADQARSGEASDSRRLLVGDVALDTGSRRVSRAGRVLELTATELAIATTLLRAAGEVVSRDRLSQEALGRRASPLDRSLDTHVANLRRKLGPGNDGTPLIRTVRGRGYQYVLPP
ncbi:MAG: response regulator transcription factor [Gammaproteobacteria bacterium]|nr:response regulator transcription factor [Gammaproteobacteria bacterium]